MMLNLLNPIKKIQYKNSLLKQVLNYDILFCEKENLYSPFINERKVSLL
jgi:hypothetical protein